MVFVLFVLIFSGLVFAQEEVDEQQKAWLEYMTPGDMHTKMAEAVGEFATVTTYWMYPDAEPMVSEGTAVNKMILGGRYLQSEHTGVAWGMTMNGISLEGYDNAQQVFKSIWIDNMGTGMAFSTGVFDEETNITTYEGEMVDPVSGDEIHYQQTLECSDNDSMLMTMYMDYMGESFKAMTVEFKRKK